MVSSTLASRLSILIIALVLSHDLAQQSAQAAPPTDAAQRAALIGQPTALFVQPEAPHLVGRVADSS